MNKIQVKYCQQQYLINKQYITILKKLRNLKNMMNLFKKANNVKYFLSKLKNVEDLLKSIKNEEGKNIIQSGSVVSHTTENEKVEINLKLDRDYRKVKAIIREQLLKEGYQHIDIKLAPKEKQITTRKYNLKNIKKIIAVSSCKGGVGKSTVAINIACTLKQLGLKVGIYDSDIYGPSLPTLINKQNQVLRPRQQNPNQIYPIDYDGLKCMSYGFVANKSAVMRGPKVSGVVAQLLYQTYWEDLDYLVIDMPPGTGDIQITLCQQIKFDGAVIVTTPQRLAYVDVIKGIQLFQDMRVKILGIVENMSYHQCPKCKNEDLVFGKGYLNMLIQQFGINNSVRIPINSQISKFCDIGSPAVLTMPKQHIIPRTYLQLVKKLMIESQKPLISPIIYYNNTNKKIIIETQQTKKIVDPYHLRIKCKCAACIDQFTGQKILKQQKINPEVYPKKIQQKGNYAVAIIWSDGHNSSIYPYQRLLGKQIESSE